MPTSNPHLNGAVQHWVMVRVESSGQYTAQAIGLPDICATAATREGALSRVHDVLRDLLVSGQLVSLEVHQENPLMKFAGHADPNDPSEKAYLEALARDKAEDLEQTLRELDQECSSTT